jgi:hypothetical protein
MATPIISPLSDATPIDVKGRDNGSDLPPIARVLRRGHRSVGSKSAALLSDHLGRSPYLKLRNKSPSLPITSCNLIAALLDDFPVSYDG